MPYNTMRGLLQVQCGIESLSNEKDLFEKEVFPDSFPIYSDDGIYRFSNGVFEKVDSSILNKYRILFQEPIPSSLFLALGEENLTIGSLDDLYSEIKDKCPVLYD